MTANNDYLKTAQLRPERHVGHTGLARDLLRERSTSTIFGTWSSVALGMKTTQRVIASSAFWGINSLNYDQRKLEKLIAQSAEKWWNFKREQPGNKMIYFKSRLRREGVMATLTREDERVISRKSRSSSAAESKAEKDD